MEKWWKNDDDPLVASRFSHVFPTFSGTEPSHPQVKPLRPTPKALPEAGGYSSFKWCSDPHWPLWMELIKVIKTPLFCLSIFSAPLGPAANFRESSPSYIGLMDLFAKTNLATKVFREMVDIIGQWQVLSGHLTQLARENHLFLIGKSWYIFMGHFRWLCSITGG